MDFALMMRTLASQFPQAFAYEERPDEEERGGDPPKSYWLGLRPEPGLPAWRCLHLARHHLVPLFAGRGPFETQQHQVLLDALPAHIGPGDGQPENLPGATALWHSFVAAGLRLHGLIP